MATKGTLFGLSILLVAIGIGPTCVAQTGGTSKNVLTWHNDNWRTGNNWQETTLTAAVVGNKNSFGRLCTAHLDGKVQAQPLVVANVKIGSTTYPTVGYVVTNKDTIYAIDGACNTLWSQSLLLRAPDGEIPASCSDIPCNSGSGGPFSGTVGILGTPVIHLASTNPATGTIYVVTESECPGKSVCNQNANNSLPWFIHRLWALDITNVRTFSATFPALICAGGCGFQGDSSTFSNTHIQRPGLLYLSSQETGTVNTVYAAFSMMDALSNQDGWIFGFNADDPTDTTHAVSYHTSPESSTNLQSGIWQSGAGLAAGKDSTGKTFIYFSSGDGDFDLDRGGTEAGNSFLKVTPGLKYASGTPYFTAPDECYRNSVDLDFGSGGTLLIPDGFNSTYPYLAIKPDKENYLWVLDRTSPSNQLGFQKGGCVDPADRTACRPPSTVQQCDPKVWPTNNSIQSFLGAPWNTVQGKAARNTAAFWPGNGSYGSLFFATEYGKLSRFTMSPSSTGTCTPGPVLCNNDTVASIPAMGYSVTPSVSSNCTTQTGPCTNGIVWVIQNPSDPPAPPPANGGPALLYAFDAVTLAELYDSNMCTIGGLPQDQPGRAMRFSVPTIANGFVYVGSQDNTLPDDGLGWLSIYGQLATRRTCQ